MNEQPMLHLSRTGYFVGRWHDWLGCLFPIVLIGVLGVAAKVLPYLL